MSLQIKSILPHVETGCVIRKKSDPVTRGNHKRQQLEAAYNVIRQNIAPAIRGTTWPAESNHQQFGFTTCGSGKPPMTFGKYRMILPHVETTCVTRHHFNNVARGKSITVSLFLHVPMPSVTMFSAAFGGNLSRSGASLSACRLRRLICLRRIAAVCDKPLPRVTLGHPPTRGRVPLGIGSGF